MSPRGRPRVDTVILDHALRLFYREGIRSTGVDRIIAEAGVAGMSFYRNFKSKDGLVAAVLKRRGLVDPARMAVTGSSRSA